jgi:hypothetical protein
VVTLSLVFAFIALCVSCITLWKTHFQRFSPLALAGNLTHRIYPIKNGDERWYISSFDVPVSVTNPGARPGVVTGLRLRLHYPELPFAGNHEFVSPKWELKAEKVNLIDKNRFNWLDEVRAADWCRFILLPKVTVTKHLLFETTWNAPVVQKRIIATLELQTDSRSDWLKVNEWELAVLRETWVDLVNGHSIGYQSDAGRGREPKYSPPDLHKFTGTKAALPKEGILSSADPSFLDYPEPKDGP